MSSQYCYTDLMTQQLTAMLINKIQVCVNKYLRCILGIRWPKRKRNVDLWQQTEQDSIETEIKKRSWRWVGHTLRKEGNITKVALEWNPQGKWKRGCPTQSWRRTHDRAEGEKQHMDGMQENSKEQDEVESTSGRPMFYLGMKRTKREREISRSLVFIFNYHENYEVKYHF